MSQLLMIFNSPEYSGLHSLRYRVGITQLRVLYNLHTERSTSKRYMMSAPSSQAETRAIWLQPDETTG